MRFRRYARLLATIAAAAILLGSGAAWATVRHYAGNVERFDAFGGQRDVPGAGDPVTFLLVGSDSREGLTDRQVRRLHTGWDVYGKRTDTMMLAHLSADGRIDVVSLPRDSEASIPAYTDENGQRHDASVGKLNGAYAFGGAPLLVQTVEDATGVQIDHYLEVNFAGFVRMVNALGGVEVCLPQEVNDIPSGLQLPAGRSTIKGRNALAYVRARSFDPTADMGRMKRQQAFVASMVHKAASSEVLLDPVRANRVANVVLGSLRVDQGLTNDQVLQFTRRVASINPSEVSFRTVPITGEKSLGAVGNVVEWDAPGAQAIFDAIKNDNAIPDAPPVPKVDVAPTGISVQLLGTGDAATRAYEDFAEAGYNVSAPWDGSTFTKTTIEYDPGYDVSLKTLQAALPGAAVVEVPGLGASFRVTIGSDYTGLQQVSVRDATAPDKPRKASDDLCG